MGEWRARALEALDSLPPHVTPEALAALAPLLSTLAMRPLDEVRDTLTRGLEGAIGTRMTSIVLDGVMQTDEVIHRLERIAVWLSLRSPD